MIEFGKSLRAAREAKGYTVHQLSEMTRMAPATIQDLESENFSHLAAPIYGRGFVKLYCEAVRIDPKPLIEEFMEIYSGNRQTEIKERPLSSGADSAADPTTPIPEPPAAEPPPRKPVQPEPDLFQSLPSRETVQDPSLSRYAAPIRQDRPLVDSQAVIRIGILAFGALLLLVLLAWGIRSVYRATTRSADEPAAVAASTPKPAAAATATGKPAARTPQKIPSLYID